MDTIKHVIDCFEKVEAGSHILSDDIYAYQGYSGRKTREFYNLICSRPNCKYLEIGTWYGSSSISALHGNTLDATFVDNWSEFGGNKQTLINALEKYKGDSSYTLIEGDAWKVNVSTLPMYDVYLYDGAHTYTDQYRAISRYASRLKDNCIVMIDDWTYDFIQKATFDALDDLGLKILY